eukprot:TRINITY_DN3485_c0_g3_i1.p1 TRINITY_DN3485_c0_g3~~TRINITY_DN3485_c0_g3_i1.p1  ORF type:complete len:252 (+),score=73.78 TRINITY_DN3485_c0_g3_i1:144-899(+)
MAERKVLNKYYPPDFDPSKLPKIKKPKNAQHKVRIMIPFTACCMTCGTFMYAGKKFNARKETVLGEDYVGIKIFRFYIKCPTCSSEITFKTDPKNSDYKMETGASRNFQPLKQNGRDVVQEVEEKNEERDALAELESRTEESKNEMDILDALDELKSLNDRHIKYNTEDLLKIRQKKLKKEEKKALKEDEALIKNIIFKRYSQNETAQKSAPTAATDSLSLYVPSFKKKKKKGLIKKKKKKKKFVRFRYCC